MSPTTLSHTLYQLEHTLVCEGGTGWRSHLLGGSVGKVDWPLEFPKLSEELHEWFAWQSAEENASTFAVSWRSAAWAARQYRVYADSSNFRPSLIPVYDEYLINVEDGSVWEHKINDDGDDIFDLSSIPDLSGLLVSIEARYAKRITSPWRSFRVDRVEGHSWYCLEVVPDMETLSAMATGTWLLVMPSERSWLMGQVVLKIASTTWMAMPIRMAVPFMDKSVGYLLETIRESFARGDDLYQQEMTHQQCADLLVWKVKRGQTKGALKLYQGVVRVWKQPAMSELIERLDSELMRVAPQVHATLSPPARDDEIAAMELELGMALPADLCALWSYANGQTEHIALYWRYRLVSIAEARATSTMMQQLAADQMGKEYWDHSMVPLFDKGNGDMLYVDVAGVLGPQGCLIDFDHEWPERRQIVFGNLREWLECFVDGIQSGVYVADPEEGIFPYSFLETGSFEEIEFHNRIRTNNRYPWERQVVIRNNS
jgi:cell wall assembly regulator SMI1